MSNVERISVTLTPEMAATMRRTVAAGEYASASELVREALREWQHRRTQREQAMAQLKGLWDEGLVSGDALDGETMFADLRRRLTPPAP